MEDIKISVVESIEKNYGVAPMSLEQSHDNFTDSDVLIATFPNGTKAEFAVAIKLKRVNGAIQ